MQSDCIEGNWLIPVNQIEMFRKLKFNSAINKSEVLGLMSRHVKLIDLNNDIDDTGAFKVWKTTDK